MLLVTVPFLDQNVGHCSHYFGLGLLATVSIFLSVCWSLFLLFWIRMLIIVPVILDQAVGECSHYFGSGCWLLFPFFYQSVGHCSYYFGSVCWLLFQ